MTALVAHNGQLHTIDVIGLGLSVLVAIAAGVWLAVPYLRRRPGHRD
jgi:hypothetical protein